MFEAYQFLSAMPFSLIRFFAHRHEPYMRWDETMIAIIYEYLFASTIIHSLLADSGTVTFSFLFLSVAFLRFIWFLLFFVVHCVLWSIRFRSLLLAFLIVVPNSWSARANSTISIHLLHRHSHAHLSHIIHSIIHFKQIRIEWPGSFWYIATNTPIYVSIHLLCSFIMHQL